GKELLVEAPLFPGIEGWESVIPNLEFSRRRLLRLGLMAGAGTVIMGSSIFHPREAEASPLLEIGEVAFVAAVSWLVSKVLDYAYGELIERAEVRKLPNPKPSGNAVHDKFASPYVFVNVNIPN